MQVLFLVGPHACGKTYSSKEYIKANSDTKMIDTGPIMRKIHQEQGNGLSIGDWVKKLESEYGKEITSNIISDEIGKEMNSSDCEKFIIVGFRTLEGILYTIDHLNIENYSILYADGTPELLYENYLLREKKDISYEEFKIYLNNELNSGLNKLKIIAQTNPNLIDYYCRETNDDSLLERINNHLQTINKNDKVRKLGENTRKFT